MDRRAPALSAEDHVRGRRGRVAVRLLAVGFLLLSCREKERLLDERPPASSTPPRQEKRVPHDDFHALLIEPAPDEAPGQLPAEALTAAVKRSNAASFEVWRALEAEKNLVVSPYSIRSALGLVYLAALPGSGRSSLQSRLHYPSQNEDMDIRPLHAVARAGEESGFGSASALWVARPSALSPAYLDVVPRSLAAEVHAIDFAADARRAQEIINAWSSERTRGRIPRIGEQGFIDEHTRSVLIDTVTLAWDSALNPGITASSFSRSFSTSQGTTVKADMLLCSPCVAVSRNDYQAAFASYRGRTSLVLVAVMPKRWRDFRWDAAAFQRVWTSFADARVAELELPKLHLRSRADLGAMLTKLDVDLADAQLTKGLLASGAPVVLDALIHEASVQVDETTVAVEHSPTLSRKLLGERVSLRVDRPFYFALVEPRTGLVLLMGQVTDPTNTDA